jgi:hypothetical protein
MVLFVLRDAMIGPTGWPWVSMNLPDGKEGSDNMTEQLTKYRPLLVLLAVLIVSALLGFAWGAAAVRVVDTGPWQLEASYQGIYVQSVADAYALDVDDGLAAQRLSFLCQSDGGLDAAFQEATRYYGSDPVQAANLDQLRTLVDSGMITENAEVPVCNTKGVSGWAKAMRILGPLVLVLGVLGVAAYFLWQEGVIDLGALPISLPTREPVAESAAAPAATPAAASPPAASTPSAQVTTRAEPVVPSEGVEVEISETESPVDPSAGESTTRRSPLIGLTGFGRRRDKEAAEPQSAASMGAQISKSAEKTDFEAIGHEPPIVQFMTTYMHGDDLYDDSFSIETPTGEFLGETGVGISEMLGTGADAKYVTALEVWLFDKNDIRTVTKVLMSDRAFNDDDVRARLAPKGEAVLVSAGDKVLLETATLRVQARIVDLAYSEGSLPPNSVFERITIELAAWKREGQSPRSNLPYGSTGSSAFDSEY